MNDLYKCLKQHVHNIKGRIEADPRSFWEFANPSN